MTAIQNILFPVNFSPACAAMAPFVKRAASLWKARVSLLYVLDMTVPGFELLVRPLQAAVEDRKQAARERLDSFLGSEFPAQDSPRLLLIGDAATQIAAAARDRGFDLIVMPTHAGIFRRMLISSTTAKVLNDADHPVLTTQHANTIVPRPLEHRECVCALGFQPSSERVLQYAGQLADSLRANLTLVHVIPAQEPGLPVHLDVEERVQSVEGESARRRANQLQRSVGTHARVIIAMGPVKDALTQATCTLGADVLLIGRGPQSGSRGRMRDLTYAMIRDAPCPVLSV